MSKIHDPELKAGVMAALLAGIGISECSRRYKVPKGTVALWSEDLHRTDAPAPTERGAERSARPRWAVDPDDGDFTYHLEHLGKEYLVGLRTLVRYLTDPDVVEKSALFYDGYSAVVAAHESLGTRVAGLIQASGALHLSAPALPPGEQAES